MANSGGCSAVDSGAVDNDIAFLSLYMKNR